MRVVSWLVQKRADAMVRKGVSSASTVKLMRTNMALSRELVGVSGLDIRSLQKQIADELKRRGVSRRSLSN
jgi:hypothetical protein